MYVSHKRFYPSSSSTLNVFLSITSKNNVIDKTYFSLSLSLSLFLSLSLYLSLYRRIVKFRLIYLDDALDVCCLLSFLAGMVDGGLAVEQLEDLLGGGVGFGGVGGETPRLTQGHRSEHQGRKDLGEKEG